jgi:hypothetical protein
LPNELNEKNREYIEECKTRVKELKQQGKIEGDTPRIEFADGGDDNTKEAMRVYAKAKRALNHGNLCLAKELFEEAEENDDLPKALRDRAIEYVETLEDLETTHAGGMKTPTVFGDNRDQLLSSDIATLDMTSDIATALSGLSTQTVSGCSSREMVAVLDQKFLADSKARGQLIIMLKTDVRKALAAIQIDDITRG